MVTADRIFEVVQAEFGVSRAQLLAPTRSSADVAYARQVAMYLCRHLNPSAGWVDIGEKFGRDRTTVRHAYNKVLDLACRNLGFGDQLRRLERVCSTSPI